MDYAAAIVHFPKITYLRAKKLLSSFPHPKAAWEAELPELIAAGLEDSIADEFIQWRETTSVEIITEDLAAAGITVLSLADRNYPELLLQITDPPPALFVRGQLPPKGQPTVSIVGTRRCTAYGIRVAKEISADLAHSGVAVVSGLALGIDGFAHSAALEANGTTVAVLGSGVDKPNVYPVSHSTLSEQIISRGGAVVSEYPPGFKPTAYSFPARNRIIAGLSLGTLIIEAPRSSGALITAARALDYNREVFAIPHPVTSEQGTGCNELLKRGAGLVRNAADILEYLQLQHIEDVITANETIPSNPTEAQILAFLSKEPRHIDELIKLTGLTSSNVNSSLTVMEMKGRVKNLGGMTYVLK